MNKYSKEFMLEVLNKLHYSSSGVNLLLRTQLRVLERKYNIRMCNDILKECNRTNNYTNDIYSYLRVHIKICNSKECVIIARYIINYFINIYELLKDLY